MDIPKKRILLVDDHPVMRFGLAQLVNLEDDLTIIGEAGTAAEAMKILESSEPDLAVVDLTLPDKSGIELIKDAKAVRPALAILVVSMHDENLYAERALRAGAKGYIMKEEAAEKLIEAIQTVLAGGVFVSPNMSQRIVEMFSGGGSSKAATPLEKLSDRELEVFEHIGRGLGSKEVAEKLNVSPRTVDAHRAHIKEKLGIRDSRELIRRAVQWLDNR